MSKKEPSTCQCQNHVSVVDPCVHVLDDEGRAAYVAYVSSRQMVDPITGQPVTTKTFTTRLWVRHANGDWKNIHFHRGWMLKRTRKSWLYDDQGRRNRGARSTTDPQLLEQLCPHFWLPIDLDLVGSTKHTLLLLIDWDIGASRRPLSECRKRKTL